MLELLESIPASFWGTLVGAASAIGAVWIKLRHERQQRRKENRFSLKRDVYMQSAEALSSAQGFLASFSRMDLSQRELLATIEGNPGWINKVHLIADFATVEAFTAAGDYFTAAGFDLLKHRAELESLNARLSRKEAERDQLVGYQRQLQSALQSTQTPALNQQEFQPASHVWNLIQIAQERLDALHREIDTDINTRLQRHLELVQFSAQHSTEFQRLLVAVNVCIRREISEPLNEAEYRHLIDSSTQAQEKHFHALLREFKERAESVDEPEPNQTASPGSIERRSE